MLNGYVRLIYVNKNYYIGWYKDHKRHGYGEFYYADGGVKRG
jgi:hypothetical protein